MLFGVRLTEGGNSAFRKSASMNNLSQYEQNQDSNADAGYASDDVVHNSGLSRERKRGTVIFFSFRSWIRFPIFFNFSEIRFD